MSSKNLFYLLTQSFEVYEYRKYNTLATDTAPQGLYF